VGFVTLRRPVVTIPLCAVALLLAGSCSRRPEPRNVIFLLVDTLRADHLGIYGYSRPTSPGLDALARRSLFFPNTRSQASCTFPSVNSILTSRTPAAFFGQPDQRIGIPDRIPTLAGILKAHGYYTAAVSASPIVRRSPGRYNPHGGFDRGFDSFLDDCVWKPAECVNHEAWEQLVAAHGRPFLLYLHYIDPHGPYAPPESYHRRFATGHPDKVFIRAGNSNPIADFLYKGAPDPGVTAADVQFLIDLYDDEIGHLDSQITALLHELARSGQLADTLIVVAADHGEEFLEHHQLNHCRDVFDTEVKVPLVLQIPGVDARRIDQPVQNLDIVPTLLDYLEIATPESSFDGRSLRPLIEGRGEPGALQYSLAVSYRSVSDGHYKLIHDLADGSFALYDLQADPGETRDVLPRERRAFHRLLPALTTWLARTEGRASANESVQMAQEEMQKLRSVGYLE